MSGEAEQPLRSELGPSETLLWSGMPAQGVRFHSSDLLLIPFSLLWGGFAVFWELSAVKNGASFFFTLWGVPFVLVGLYITVGRFFFDAYQRNRTYYGLTNQRAIIVTGVWSRRVTSIALKSLQDTALSERADKRGTIRLGPASPLSGMFTGTGWPGIARSTPPTFDMIPDARKVYEQLRSTQASPLQGGA